MCKMTSYVEEVLAKLGWHDGFQIPVANAENRELEEEMARLSLKKVQMKTAFENSLTKLDNLNNHLKYVSQESEQNQNLITAHAQQLQIESVKLRTNIAERDKIEQEIRQFEKKTGDIQERLDIKKTQLQRCALRLEKLKTETNWDEEALRAWEESLKKRDDDNEMLKKFSKEDEKKYKELDAKRESLEKEYTNRKHTIEKMVCDITNYERMLERTGKAMKQQVTERNALIQQWKDSVKILHQRDREIDRLQLQIVATQEIIDKEQEKLEEQREFHMNEIRNNEELEHESAGLNALNSKMRQELNDLSQYILRLNSEADSLRRTLMVAVNHVEKERHATKHLKEKILNRERRIAQVKIQMETLKEKYDDLKQSSMSSDDHIMHLEKLIDFEQKLQATLDKDNELMQYSYFRAQQELQEQIMIGKSRDIDIHGASTNINHIRKHNDDKRKRLEKQKEDAYELDYKVDEVQRKILANENVYLGDDKEELERKIGEIEARLAEHTEIKLLLKDQVNKIQDDMRRLTTAITTDQYKLSVSKDKLQDQILNFEGGQKQLELSKQLYQEKQVEENILLLRVNQLSNAMKTEEKNIFSLQKLRLSLEQATTERILEIDTNKELLLVTRRNLNEDKGRLKCDIMERKIRLTQFQKKYDIVLKSLGKDENGQPYSVTHFKIKNAQEKFFLQQEGDELDNKIKKAEKEIVAMENTLRVVNLTNVAFKRSLGPVEEDGEEMNERTILEEEQLGISDQLRAHRKDLAKKRQEIIDAQVVLETMEEAMDEEEKSLVNMEEEYLKAEKQRMEKEEKIKRTERCLKLAEKKISKTVIEKFDRDLEIRQLKDANQAVMQKISEMAIRCQEVAPLINQYTAEHDIKISERQLSLPKMDGSYTSVKTHRSTCSSLMRENAIEIPSPKSSTSSEGSNRSANPSEKGSVKSGDSNRSAVLSKVDVTFNP